MRKITFLILIFFFNLLSASTHLSLTKEEQKYLKNNPVITMSIGYNAKFYKDKDGSFKGINVDFIKLIEQRLGVKFKLYPSNWKGALKRIKDKKVDTIMHISKNEKREKFVNFTDTYIQTPQTLVAKQSENSITDIKDFCDRKIAITKDTNRYKYLEKICPNNNFVLVNNAKEVVEAMAKGKAEAGFDNFDNIISNINKMLLVGYKVIYFKYMPPVGFNRIGIVKEKPLLSSILNKAVQSINEEEKNSIIIRHLGIKMPSFEDHKLTQEDKQYLKSNNSFTVCTQYDKYPLSAVKDGKLIGIMGDIFDEISTTLNISFKAVDVVSYQDLYQKAAQNRCDFITVVGNKQKRFKNIKPSQVIYKNHFASMGSLQSFFMNNQSDLAGHTFFVRWETQKKSLKKAYPNINVKFLADKDKIINLIQTNDLYHFVDTKMMIELAIQEYGFDKYKINGIFDKAYGEVCIGVNEKLPKMLTILNKALHQIGQESIQNSFQKYSINEFKIIKKDTYLWYILGISFIVILLLFSRYRFIQKTNELINNEKEKFQILFEKSKNSIGVIDLETNFLNFNDAYLEMTGFTREELLQESCLNLSVKEDIPKAKKAVQEAIEKGYVKNFEKSCYKKDGSIAVVNMSISLLPDNKRLLISVIDITKQKQKERELEIEKERLDKAYHNLQKFIDTQNNIVIVSNGQTTAFANKRFFDFLQYSDLKEFKKKHLCICEFFIKNERFFHMGKVEQNETWIDALLKLQPSKRVVSMQGADAAPHTFTISINAFDKDNYIISFADISQTMLEHIQLEQKTITDKLTGAYNREYFEQYHQIFLSQYTKGNNKLALAILDIDHFKLVNDTHGHDVGDIVLKHFVETIKKYSREEDIFIRWGGEEFLLILKVKSEVNLQKAIEHIRNVIALEKFPIIEHKTCSIGASIYKKSEPINETIKRADEALYEAKSNGRDQVMIKL